MVRPLRVNLTGDGTYTKLTPGGTFNVKGTVDCHKVTARGNITITGGPIRVSHTDLFARPNTYGIIVDGANIHIERCRFAGDITVTSETVLEHTEIRTPVPLALPEFTHASHGDIRGPKDVVVIPFVPHTDGSRRTATIYPDRDGTHVVMFDVGLSDALVPVVDVQYALETADRTSADGSLLRSFTDDELDTVIGLSATVGA